ncbi:hypothetical protein E8E12_010313 [Didymella heteroderae]|uniref:Uncharacterized protein n=1 Tax=Didymella heteroderae TaxID=1769908 RepID=A0A9P4WVP8_9PLEO|nr:hypothetical protein E8E12_010313 [Didymella heteroderae]
MPEILRDYCHQDQSILKVVDLTDEELTTMHNESSAQKSEVRSSQHVGPIDSSQAVSTQLQWQKGYFEGGLMEMTQVYPTQIKPPSPSTTLFATLRVMNIRAHCRYRRKLRPKQPPKGGVHRRRINAPPNYGKEEKLTLNQQAWARAFTVSLSGWRSRQKFYKDHREAESQAELEAKATEAAYDAEHLAQRKTDEQEEAERKARELAEEEEEKAEAWAHKACEMHKAGRGVRKLKHEYYGWDPEDEEYPRDLGTEKMLARAKAKRMAERRAAAVKAGVNPYHVYDTDKDSNNDSESDSSSGLDIVDPDSARSMPGSQSLSGSQSRSPPRPAPIIERPPKVDWREKARVGVVKKKLSVTKAWGAITWNQKSNVQERLIVLEDDGYDISELLNKKAPSEQVTNIILARAAGNQPFGSSAVQPSVQPGPFSSSQGGSGGLPPEWLNPALSEQFLGPADEGFPPGSTFESLSSPASPPRSAVYSPQPCDNELEDDTQPFSFDESYHPQPSRPCKRKRDDGADVAVGDGLALSLPAYKKRKVEFVAEDELAAQALQGIKKAIFRDIYRSSGSGHFKPLPPSQIVFTADDQSVKPKRAKSQASGLDYLYPKSSRRASNRSVDAINSGLSESNSNNLDPETARRISTTTSSSISKCAFDNIMAELRFLTDTAKGEDTIQIFDPDFDEDLTYMSVKLEERIKQNTRLVQRQASRVVITMNTEGQTVFQGNSTVLVELLRALRERVLLHHADWKWDGLRLRQSNDLVWHLSPQTDRTFIDIATRLELRSRTVKVGIIVGGEDGVKTDAAWKEQHGRIR